MGWHCSDTAELSYVDVRVPVANLVGEENTGFYQIAEQFVVERIALAVHAYGIAARSLELTAAYCRDRETFGKPLIANQVVRHKLVEMRRQVEVARTYTRAVAERHVAGESVIAEACLAKQTACDAATYVCDQAVQLHGGTGYMHGTEVERHYRDARILPIGGGATEVLTDLAARAAGVRVMSLFRPLGGEVSLHMDAPPEKVWALVSDVTRIGEFSPETFEARWTRGSTGPEVGASFKGHVKRNGVGPTYWSPCQVTECVPERGLRVRGRHRRRSTVNNWGYRLRGRRGPGTEVTEYFRLEPSAAMRVYWAAARPAPRPHQRAGHAHHAGADEGGGRGSDREPRGDAREARRPRRRARQGGRRRRREVRRPPPRPRQAAAARADRAARSTRARRSSSCRRWPAGARTSPSAPAWSPASA